MNRYRILALTLLLLIGACGGTTSTAEPFKRAQLRVEINATDGDAGLQIDLDHEPWKSLRIDDPRGKTLLELTNRETLAGYGLTELFSESSEPPFTELPLDEWKLLFPAGEYVFSGTTIEGAEMRSVVMLSHDFPAGPEILSPEANAMVPPDALVAQWRPVEVPGVEIVAYQVVVVHESEPARSLQATVPPEIRRLVIPAEFLSVPGDYKLEVLAIARSGNQTLTEVPFQVG